MSEFLPAIYIMTNHHNTTLYTGVTSDLIKRVYQHKNKFIKGFSQKYNCNKLVYYELHLDMYCAISREKQIKAGPRKKKIELVEKTNPEWKDLYDSICL
jgi:putative endonuclease